MIREMTNCEGLPVLLLHNVDPAWEGSEIKRPSAELMRLNQPSELLGTRS